MRLIDAPIGIFRFDGELVLKTEYYSEDKQSGKYIPDCYIIRTGEYFWGGTKTANELINLDIEPVDFAELLPTVTDTISRQAAIEAVGAALLSWSYMPEWRDNKIIEAVEQLPPIQPDNGLQKLADEIASFKRHVKSENSDYLTGYLCALSVVEGMIAERREVTT